MRGKPVGVNLRFSYEYCREMNAEIRGLGPPPAEEEAEGKDVQSLDEARCRPKIQESFDENRDDMAVESHLCTGDHSVEPCKEVRCIQSFASQTTYELSESTASLNEVPISTMGFDADAT